MIVPDAYPIMPPSIKFLTKVYHPNIDDSGRICLDLIKMPPKGSWRPTIGIEALLIAVRMLLESPNAEDPLMVDIAQEYQRFCPTSMPKGNFNSSFLLGTTRVLPGRLKSTLRSMHVHLSSSASRYSWTFARYILMGKGLGTLQNRIMYFQWDF